MADAWGGSWGASWLLSWTRSDYEAVTDDDFALWLSTPSKRCVLAEFSATGYDALGSPGQTKTVNAYIANRGFTSHSTDAPASQHYNSWITGIPTFRREMGVALSGRATTGFGTLKVSNPAAGGAGVRDDWLRMKWKRDYVTLYIGEGHPWHKSDFRKIVVGTLGQPTAPRVGEIEFAIADILDRLDRPLQVNRYSTGPMAGKLKPILQGYVQWMEPVPTGNPLEFQINDGPIAGAGEVYDDGVSLAGAGEVDTVDTGTDTITTTEPHGLSVDARVNFISGSMAHTPPAPLTYDVDYYVIAAGLGGSTFRLAATRGGSAIDLTTTGTAGSFRTYGWWEDLPNGLITLTASPAGRIMVKGAASDASGGDLCKLPNVISELIFNRFGLSTDFKDEDSFDDLVVDYPNLVGVVFYDHDSPTALEALERLCKGTNCWYGSTPDGQISVGRLKLPESTAELEFNVSEVKEGSLRLSNRILPINVTSLAIRYDRVFTLNGPLNLSADKEPGLLSPYWVDAGYSLAGTGTLPLDEHPDTADSVDLPPMDSLISGSGSANNEAVMLQAFRKKTLGTFVFETKVKACRLKIGQTIQLTHPRLGWKQYDGSDPQSPDNMSNFDATKAVVVGIDVNLSAADPFPVRLTVFRQIPGYYPTEDLN